MWNDRSLPFFQPSKRRKRAALAFTGSFLSCTSLLLEKMPERLSGIYEVDRTSALTAEMSFTWPAKVHRGVAHAIARQRHKQLRGFWLSG